MCQALGWMYFAYQGILLCIAVLGVVLLSFPQLRASRQPTQATEKWGRLRSVPSVHSTPKSSSCRRVVPGVHAHQEPAPFSLQIPSAIRHLSPPVLLPKSSSWLAWPHTAAC